MRTTPSFEDIIERFEIALNRFAQNDHYLIENDVYEKAMTHKIAEYLQQLFPDWNVDCEYNRNGHEPKNVRLDENALDEEGDLVPTYPDIIVHERGTNRFNLLVIEAKKSNDRRVHGNEFDRRKLMAYASQLHYQIGIFLRIIVASEVSHSFRYETFYENQWRENQ